MARVPVTVVGELVSVVGEIERPHEILGLMSVERDPVAIVAAALAKLRVIRSSNGSEVTVRRTVEAVVIQARDQLLAKAFLQFTDDFPETNPTAVGAEATSGKGIAHRD
jgi:hypothetical protein